MIPGRGPSRSLIDPSLFRVHRGRPTESCLAHVPTLNTTHPTFVLGYSGSVCRHLTGKSSIRRAGIQAGYAGPTRVFFATAHKHGNGMIINHMWGVIRDRGLCLKKYEKLCAKESKAENVSSSCMVRVQWNTTGVRMQPRGDCLVKSVVTSSSLRARDKNPVTRRGFSKASSSFILFQRCGCAPTSTTVTLLPVSPIPDTSDCFPKARD